MFFVKCVLVVISVIPTCVFADTPPVPKNSTLVRFSEFSPGLYRGSMPQKDIDFEFLRSIGVRTILDLRMQPRHIRAEHERAEKYGMDHISVPIEGWIFPPSEIRVNRTIDFLANQSLRPTYIHCELGRDRTSLIVGLYRIYYENIDPETAYNEMLFFGFKEVWYLWGLKHYFNKHKDIALRYSSRECPLVRPLD